jgi:hypothetical protein
MEKQILERNLAVLSCLRAAVTDPFKEGEKLSFIDTALQYGKSIGLTRRECLRVMKMRFIDIFGMRRKRK